MNLLLETHHIFKDKIDQCDFSEGDGSSPLGTDYVYCSSYGIGDGKGSSIFFSSLYKKI